jgi:acylphosphatase
MSEPAQIIVHVVVHGRVQGVGYRAYVAREAVRHCVEGWVRNCRDGTVEAVFKGEAEVIDDMLAACRKGPPMSRVDNVTQRAGSESDLRARVPGEEFSLLPTF